MWNLTPETWHLTPDTWHLTPDTWHLTPDTWHLTPDTCHLTPDTSHMTHSVGLIFSQNFSSLALPVWDWQCLEQCCAWAEIFTRKRWIPIFPPSIFSKIWWKLVDFCGFWAKNLTSLRDAALRRGRSPRMQLADSPLLRPQPARGDNVGPRG